MPLNLFYTMVQKSQKWPKTQIKGGPALSAIDPSRLHLGSRNSSWSITRLKEYSGKGGVV